MTKYDFDIAILVWLIALGIGWYLGKEIALIMIVSATFNLWHQRYTDYHSGQIFEDRVMKVVAEQLTEQNKLIADMRVGVQEVRDTQVKMGASFSGRRT